MSFFPAREALSLATREQVVTVLELLATRMQWSTARPIISSTSLHVSRGWQETLEGVRKDAYSDAIWTSAYNTLAKATHQHTYVGNKHVSFFDLREQNSAELLRILNWARASAIGDLNGTLRRRPFRILSAPSSGNALEEFKGSTPNLIAVDFFKEKLYLQFFSVRSYSHREPLDITKMGVVQQKFFAEYEELIGVKTKAVPCFDTVVVDIENQVIEIRIDFQPGMTEDKNTPALARIVGELTRVAARFIDHAPIGVGLVNLHPAINPMYMDGKCGRVTALGFVATGRDSASNNRGQIHRTRTKDFRKDAFHVGGSQSVDRIDPYAIGITWPGEAPRSDLYLELKGSVRSIYASKLGAVIVAEIVGCLDGTDFDFVTGQVLSRLNRKKK